MKDSITTLTIKLFQLAGYMVCKTEYFNYYAKRRFDLFNFIDAVGLREGAPIAGIQCSTLAHATERKAKIESLPAAHIWKNVGSVYLVSWRELKVNQTKQHKVNKTTKAINMQVPRVELLVPAVESRWLEISDWEESWLASMNSSVCVQRKSAPSRGEA